MFNVNSTFIKKKTTKTEYIFDFKAVNKTKQNKTIAEIDAIRK